MNILLTRPIEPSEFTVDESGPPPTTAFAIKISTKGIVERKGSKPFHMYDPVKGSHYLVHDKARRILIHWKSFDSIVDFIGWLHSKEKQLRSINSVLVAQAKGFAIDGMRVTMGEFVKAIKIDEREISFKDFIIDNDLADKLELTMSNDNKCIIVGKSPNASKWFKNLDEAEDSDSLITLFHGTSKKRLKHILNLGLQPSRDGALGPGVYLGEFNKAFAFSTQSRNGVKTDKGRYWRKYNKAEDEIPEDIKNHRVILECDVILRNVMDRYSGILSSSINDRLEPYKAWPGDVFFRGFKQPEWCVRDLNRVLIKKIHVVY